MPKIAILSTIPGIGKILSALVALEIDDISRFSYADKLCAYAGLVPTTYASGGKIPMEIYCLAVIAGCAGLMLKPAG